ncbi:MAG TPA: 2-C-methyl-D-erythritol 4-phosphate cytidylyltransferase [Puia sp.]|uniref:2-C-methyl-D-erythritol 4-phosphate cytidylyltransferase n=1 Tax=Puia sp. TaxID=2045100 RepID=UPI002BFE92E7|nr:2-C-methyl-D-erythritol 4-phosphate cytidylyltransferase [Puia sp.]HVU94906.1 2-C-methyl-D-erythritol 4-phosphate cytidylyltransferase [Puia sp.]
MNKYAVIVAGGSGSRMGAPVPKQFLLLEGKPLLWYSINIFLAAYDELSVILVVPAGHWEVAKDIAASVAEPGRVRMVEGGETRFLSVRNGLRLVERESVVGVHDGVRCLASVGLVRRCFEQAIRLGSAIPVVDCKDSVRWVEGEGSRPLDRSRIRLVQTPQTFLGGVLLDAFGAAADGGAFTDEATVVEAAGRTVHLVEGEVSNIKITTPDDLVLAAEMLRWRL